MEDNLKYNVSIKLIKNNREVISCDYHNIMTTYGITTNTNNIAGDNTPICYMGLGSDTTTPMVGNTTLNKEITLDNYSRVNMPLSSTPVESADGSSGYRVVSGNIITYTATFSANNAKGSTIKEAGLFTNKDGSTLCNHVVFDELIKDSDDVLEISWKVTIGN